MLHRDCIFYKYSGNPNWTDIQSGNNENFCSFSFESTEEEEVIQAKILWLDPIRIRDKIITSERKFTNFLIFEDKKVIGLFGGSESQVAYTVTKLTSFFAIKMEKIILFENFSSNYVGSESYNGFRLTSFDISMNNFVIGNNTYTNIPVSEIDREQISDYLNSSKVISLILLSENESLYFSLDLYSIVSFFDTDEDNSIIKVCKRIVVNIE